MRKIFIKICGITDRSGIDSVYRAGADAFGLVVGIEESPRNIDPEEAAGLRRYADALEDGPVSVLVMKDISPKRAVGLIAKVQPRYIQYYPAGNDYGLYKRITEESGFTSDRIIVPLPLIGANLRDFGEIKKVIGLFGTEPVYLYDRSHGRGRSADITFLLRLFDEFPECRFMAAGGITPNNVGEIVKSLSGNPSFFGVDVSSGVEIAPGVKSRKLITELVENVGKITELNHKER